MDRVFGDSMFLEEERTSTYCFSVEVSLMSEDVKNMHKRNVVLLGMLLGCVSVAQADTTTTTLQGVNNPTLTLSTLNWGDITLNIGGQYTGTVNNSVLSLTETTGGSLSDALFSISFSQPVGSLGIRGLSLYGSALGSPTPAPLPVLDTPVPEAILPVVDSPIIGGGAPVIGDDAPAPADVPAPLIIEETPAPLEVPELISPIIEASPVPVIETILASDPVPTDDIVPPIVDASPDPVILEDISLTSAQNGQHGQGGHNGQGGGHDHHNIPEPATLAYMGLTGIFTTVMRRRKK
jgi:hypothetical protein